MSTGGIIENWFVNNRRRTIIKQYNEKVIIYVNKKDNVEKLFGN